MSVGIELHGPTWFWIALGVYVIVVAPFVHGFAEAAVKDWQARKSRAK